MKTRVAVAVAATILLVYRGQSVATQPLSTIQDSPPFRTAEEAARAALNVALPLARDQEFGGAIFEWNTSYYYTHPVTNSHREYSSLDAEGPEGSRLAAIYHTHTRHDMEEYFSATDIATARRLGVKSYLGIVSGRRIRVFDPATMRGGLVIKKEHFGYISRGLSL
jgi:hypothetical protein